ncbi:MAG: MmgE/PrpD family protein [Candidatus Methylomirabilia bacterium]
MHYLDRLAALVHRTSFAALDASTLAAAKRVLLDTLGAVIAGSRLEHNARLARLVAERSASGAASLLGHRRKADPMLAALVNATAGVSLEVDEGTRFGGGHPAIHVVPALVAVGEELGVDGPRLLESLIVGYEVVSRIGGATVPRFNVHSHGTWGTVGAAVAVAKLSQCDEGQIREVINLAASMSPANSWTPCFEGATIRNLYPGRAGLQGILAVHLLRAGFTGLGDAPADVYGILLGERFEPEHAVEGLEAEQDDFRFRIEGNYFKFHACCLFNHPTLDAVRAIREAQPFTSTDIARITVTSIPFAPRMAGGYPRNMLAAKFSIPYAVAAAIVTGRTDATAFDEATIGNPGIRELAEKVEVRSDPEMSMRRSDYPSAVVSIQLKDGRVLSRSTTVVRGDAANPIPHVELVDKFLSLAGPVLGESRAKAVIESVGRVEDMKDVRELTTLLVPGDEVAASW